MDYFDTTGLHGRDKEIVDELYAIHTETKKLKERIDRAFLPDRDKSNYTSYFTDLISELEHDALVTREHADYSMETRDED